VQLGEWLVGRRSWHGQLDDDVGIVMQKLKDMEADPQARQKLQLINEPTKSPHQP
jgi:hypothetical protein